MADKEIKLTIQEKKIEEEGEKLKKKKKRIEDTIQKKVMRKMQMVIQTSLVKGLMKSPKSRRMTVA